MFLSLLAANLALVLRVFSQLNPIMSLWSQELEEVSAVNTPSLSPLSVKSLPSSIATAHDMVFQARRSL